MAWKKVKVGNNEFEVSHSSYWLVIFGIIALIVIATFAMSFYTVDTNENGVVLRFGKFYKITEPGLHWKLPWNIDKLYRVKVDFQYKEEFGFRTERPGVKSRYSGKEFTDESWMLTGDLNISDVKWIVQYRIKDPMALLFNVRDVEGTIRDVAESTMRSVVGDRSFHEVLQSDRAQIALLVRQMMQEILDEYEIGISIKLVQLKDVHPPGPVRDSFNEVNRAKQEQETVINQARQMYNKEIFRAEGEGKKMVQEAHGYAINRTNNATGDARLFLSVYDEYKKAKDVTRTRLYLETMEDVFQRANGKYLIDQKAQGILPLLNLQGREVTK